MSGASILLLLELKICCFVWSCSRRRILDSRRPGEPSSNRDGPKITPGDMEGLILKLQQDQTVDFLTFILLRIAKTSIAAACFFICMKPTPMPLPVHVQSPLIHILHMRVNPAHARFIELCHKMPYQKQRRAHRTWQSGICMARLEKVKKEIRVVDFVTRRK